MSDDFNEFENKIVNETVIEEQNGREKENENINPASDEKNKWPERERVFSDDEPEKKKSKVGTVLKKAVAIAMSAVLFGSVAGGTLYGVNHILDKAEKTETTTKSSTSAASENKTKNPVDTKLTKASDDNSAKTGNGLSGTSESLDVTGIVEKCMPSIVAITNMGVSEVRTFWGTYQQPSQSAGSGVIIAKTDAEILILTNYHVVSGNSELTVVFSFDEKNEEPDAVQAYVKGYEPELDLAVISIPLDNVNEEILDKIAVAVVGDSDELQLGEQVVAIGNALGYGQSVTTGIVSALDRTITLTGSDGTTLSNEYIQTDAAINPGNSGGALLNMKGELIGINSAKASSTQVEGTGYALPISDVFDEIEQMMNEDTKVKLSSEKQGYIGISGESLDETTAARYHVPQGAYVTEVYKDLAADRAGIVKGDIITKVNDVEVKSMEELKSELASFAAGEKVTITYIRYSDESRSYEEEDTEVELDDYETFKKIVSENSSSENNSEKNNGGYNGIDEWDYFFGN